MHVLLRTKARIGVRCSAAYLIHWWQQAIAEVWLVATSNRFGNIMRHQMTLTLKTTINKIINITIQLDSFLFRFETNLHKPLLFRGQTPISVFRLRETCIRIVHFLDSSKTLAKWPSFTSSIKQVVGTVPLTVARQRRSYRITKIHTKNEWLPQMSEKEENARPNTHTNTKGNRSFSYLSENWKPIQLSIRSIAKASIFSSRQPLSTIFNF